MSEIIISLAAIISTVAAFFCGYFYSENKKNKHAYIEIPLTDQEDKPDKTVLQKVFEIREEDREYMEKENPFYQ